jgi:hypothetical protein
MFIKKSDKIAVGSDGVVGDSAITPEMDVIWITRKMNFGTRAEFARLFAKGDKSNADASLIMMDLCIVGWQGPSFGDVPVTPETIRELDQDEPLVAKVLEEIGTRNTPPADPNSETSKSDT